MQEHLRGKRHKAAADLRSATQNIQQHAIQVYQSKYAALKPFTLDQIAGELLHSDLSLSRLYQKDVLFCMQSCQQF